MAISCEASSCCRRRRLLEAGSDLVPVAAMAVADTVCGAGSAKSFNVRAPGDRPLPSCWRPCWCGALILCRVPLVYHSIWIGMRALPLIAARRGHRQLVRLSGTFALSPDARARVFLLITMAAVVALVQFPFAVPIYFCYAAPLTALALLAVVSGQPHAPRRFHACAAAFFLLFAILFLNRAYPWYLGVQYVPYQADGWLDLPRGGVRVPMADKQDYETLVRVIQQHADGGIVYAGPDCPEVYFLSGFKNPTRAFFDFLDPQEDDPRWMASLVSKRRGRVAVINTKPLFSAPLRRDAEDVLERQLPASETVGRFVVRYER